MKEAAMVCRGRGTHCNHIPGNPIPNLSPCKRRDKKCSPQVAVIALLFYENDEIIILPFIYLISIHLAGFPLLLRLPVGSDHFHLKWPGGTLAPCLVRRLRQTFL